MARKSLVISIAAHSPYIRHLDGEYVSKNTILFNAVNNTYLPLLNMFSNLEAEGVAFKVNMVLSPLLCSMLADPVIQQQYIEWQEKLIILGEAEVGKYKSGDARKKLAEEYLEQARTNLKDFQETFNQDLLSKFRYYINHGNIEVMATAATNCFLPHYIDMPEAVQAQIETGIQLHKEFFGVVPEGFWMPYMGYTSGLERLIRPYGFNYSIVNTHSLLFAEKQPENGIFSPVRCRNSLVLFGCDSEKNLGFMKNPVYRNQEKDIGFEADDEYLEKTLGNLGARVETGFRYTSMSADSETWYDREKALAQAKADAEAFIKEKKEKLSKAVELMDDVDASLVCTFDASYFGGSWYEGVEFLNQVIRGIYDDGDIELSSCSELINQQYQLPRIEPFAGAYAGTGYGENLLDKSNSWMLRYVRKACERMTDLSGRFTDDTGLKPRTLNLAAKELLLAMSDDWAQMVHDGNMPEYAEERFRQSIAAFSTVYDSLGSNSISTEWLTRMEKEHPFFGAMNYHVFSRRK